VGDGSLEEKPTGEMRRKWQGESKEIR
jgi:hypothetical protein